jgi:hypothetical protein
MTFKLSINADLSMRQSKFEWQLTGMTAQWLLYHCNCSRFAAMLAILLSVLAERAFFLFKIFQGGVRLWLNEKGVWVV